MHHIKIIFFLLTIAWLSACANYDEELKKIPEFGSLNNTLRTKKTFTGFPPSLSWKLLIGANKQDQGPLIIDTKEPGYFAGVSRGLDYALKHDKEALSVELIEEIRKQATESVSKNNQTAFEAEIGGSDVKFDLVLDSNASKTGLAKLRTSLIGDPLRSIRVDKNNQEYLYRKEVNRKIIYPIMKKILDNYEHSSKSIEDIIILIQNLFQLHPFNDGNTRTFAIILLQKELARNGHTPVILYNPKRFAAYSIKELLEEMRTGQARFKSYLVKSS